MHILDRENSRNVKQVRLVGEGGNTVVPIADAFRQAEDAGLDLVCVSDNSEPWVVRIQDFKKLEYERKKAKQVAKAKSKSSELKEIQLKVNISDHDLEVKLNRIRKFLDRGDKVKLVVRLKGRERQSPERAKELIDRVVGQVECRVSKLPGPMAITILEPPKA